MRGLSFGPRFGLKPKAQGVFFRPQIQRSQPAPGAIVQKMPINTLDPSGKYEGCKHFLLGGGINPQDTLRLRGGFEAEVEFEATVSAGKFTEIHQVGDFFAATIESFIFFPAAVPKMYHPYFAEALTARLTQETAKAGWPFGTSTGDLNWRDLEPLQRTQGHLSTWTYFPMPSQPQNYLKVTAKVLMAVDKVPLTTLEAQGRVAAIAVFTQPKAFFIEALAALEKRIEQIQDWDRRGVPHTVLKNDFIGLLPMMDWAQDKAPERIAFTV